MMTPHLPLLIPVTFLFTSLVIPLVGTLGRTWAAVAAIVGCALSFVFSLAGLKAVLTTGPMSYHLAGWAPPMGIEFVLDPLSVFMQVVITGVTLMVLIYTRGSLEFELPDKIVPFYCLAMILMTGLTGMVITGDLFNLYVFLEIGALAGYALLAIGNKRASFSAFRYLTLGTVGAAFYLLGVAFIFMSTGTLNMADVARLLPMVNDSLPVTAGLVLIMLGAGLKMGLFPLHAWLPDGYTNASSAATALIAPIGTKVAAYILIRIYILSDFPPIIEVFSWIAAVGILAGSILAIAQTNFKRMLAYSSVANIGYIALGFSMANHLAFTGAMLHILNHALMKGVLFLVAGGVLQKMGTLDISRFRGLRRKMPLTAIAFLVAVLSMVGIPPTGGFFSKLYLVLGAIEEKTWVFVAVILASTLLNFVYFFKIIEVAFFKPQSDDPQEKDGFERPKTDEMVPSMLIPTLILAALIVLVGVFNGDIVGSIIRQAMPAGF
jgi:multicomponent Na+:H+ antiporter subunit D